MIPRLKTGKGVTGAVRYTLGEGRDPKTRELYELAAGEESRVAWIGGTGFGFEIESRDDADLARRVMEFDALNQKSRTRQCEQDCVHLSLAWARGQTPTRKEMEEAAHEALEALGMANAKALFVCHRDEDHPHLHLVISKINPDTGRAYDLAASHRKLSKWALEYEREHGGVQLKGREDMNELRDAIARRDAGGVLEAMTRQRSTFTGKELERALQKEIYAKRGASHDEKRGVDLARAQFADKILDHAEAVHLSDGRGGPTTRYTTRKVLEGEGYVWRAAEGLAANKTHGLTDAERAATLNSARHDGISREQARAFRHATGDEGLAIIDGLAGAGKSRTTNAVREAYEAAGHRVIGLAWTHKVVHAMEENGFENTSTVKRELFMLANGRQQWDSKTVVVVDEAAMLDTAHMAMITAYAQEAGAKLILVGDDRQLPSIERGGMFGVLKDRFGAATLTEIQRQASGDDRRASEYFAEGQFHKALGIYDAKGGIHWTRTQPEARAELLDTYRADVTNAPDKSRFIFAYTNIDVAELNKGAREVHRQLGRLGEDHELETADGRLAFAAGDRIQFTKTDKKLGFDNGSAGTVRHIENGRVFAELDGGKVIGFDSAEYRNFRHGYAGTIYKGQGDTVDQAYLYHSEHWRSAASYVGMTRHREKAELFAATNTAENLDQLARQMARVDEGKRYAASMFHHRQEIGPTRPLTAAEIVAHFADRGFEREQQQQDERQARRSAAGDMGYSHGGYASQSRAALRDHERRQRQQQQDKQPMEFELDERRKRRAAPIAPDFNPMQPERPETQERPPMPTRPANQNDQPPAPEQEARRSQDDPFERDGRPFRPSEQQPGHYEALKPEEYPNRVWVPGIEELHGRPVWCNDDDQIAGYAEKCLAEFERQADEAKGLPDPFRPPEPRDELEQHALKLWLAEAEKALGVPITTTMPENEQRGDHTDERDDLILQALRARQDNDREPSREAEARKPPTLDDIAERVQQILDDPTREDNEHDDVILQALRAHREQGEIGRPATPENEPREAQADRQREDDARRSAGDDKPSIYERFPGLTREENDARQREHEEERGGDAEGGEGNTQQGGRDGGRERSSQ